MKLRNILTLGLLGAALVFNPVQGAEQNKNQKPKVVQKTSKKNAAPSKTEQNLKRFNDTIGMRFFGYSFSQAQNGEPLISFNYALENKGKRNIRSVQWAATYYVNGKAILTQDSPVSFDKALKGRTTSELSFTVPFKSLPAEAQKAFSTPQTQIQAQFQAKNVIFANGSKIVVSK